jgi:hypothetical protein
MVKPPPTFQKPFDPATKWPRQGEPSAEPVAYVQQSLKASHPPPASVWLISRWGATLVPNASRPNHAILRFAGGKSRRESQPSRQSRPRAGGSDPGIGFQGPRFSVAGSKFGFSQGLRAGCGAACCGAAGRGAMPPTTPTAKCHRHRMRRRSQLVRHSISNINRVGITWAWGF